MENKNYIIIDIPLRTKRDKKLFLLIKKLTKAKWKHKDTVKEWIPPYREKFIDLYIETYECIWGMSIYRNLNSDYNNWPKYNYRDFLKLHKVSTKEFLSL